MSLRNEQYPKVEPAPQTQPDVAWLREARERKGITLEHLANTTKICPKYLTAIEAGAVDKLPPAFFTRGFVKTYAKEVGLNPDQTADRYLQQIAPVAPDQGEDVAAIVETAVSRTGVIGFDAHHAPLINSLHPDRSNRLVLAAAAIGVVLYIGPFNWDGLASKVGAMGITHPAPAVAAPVATPAPAAAVTPEPLAAADVTGGALQFEIKPQGECWFSAAADGNQTQSELLKAGDQRPIEVRDALVLRVGDPGACSFSINGRTGRALGTPGAPVTVRITKDNFRDFLSS